MKDPFFAQSAAQSIPHTTSTGQPATHYSAHSHPLGTLVIASSEAGLCFMGFDDAGAGSALADLQRRFSRAVRTPVPPDAIARHRQAFAVLQTHYAQLGAAESSEKPKTSDIALAPQGTSFQMRVWQALRETAWGETLSYAALAARMGYAQPQRMARAIGGAVAANPIAVLIPCHRVLPAHKTHGAQRGPVRIASLGGYRWGPERKAALLRAEGVIMAQEA